MMEDLLALAIESHGGQARWDAIRGVTAELSIGGALWEIKGKAGILQDAHYEADTHIQRATLSRFTAPDRRVRFTRDRLVLETDAGMVIETRNNPRSSFVGHTQESSWDDLHVAYFSGYAMWTYLTQPFLYAYQGFEAREIDSWEEDGEVWRRLEVIFPSYIASHTRRQVSYFGPDGLIRRHDYAVDVLGGSAGAHYISGYREFDGIVTPTHRRVFAMGPKNRPVPDALLVSIDVVSAHFL
jgi:hypothetical protein